MQQNIFTIRELTHREKNSEAMLQEHLLFFEGKRFEIGFFVVAAESSRVSVRGRPFKLHVS